VKHTNGQIVFKDEEEAGQKQLQSEKNLITNINSNSKQKEKKIEQDIS
jgi:hypothetical protein